MRWKKHDSYSYIGVTGFMNNSEVKKAIEIVPENTTYNLMVGVLMSSKTLTGFANKYPGRYPQRENVADIFIDHPKALNLIHYSTDAPEKLLFELYCLTDLGGKNLDGFQLNIAWPSVSQLESYFYDHPETFIVLQIGKRAMAEVDKSPEKLADMVEKYIGIIDAILIDQSGGKGEPLKIVKTREYLKVIHDRQYPISLGVAGGLGPKTLHTVKPLSDEFLGLNIDAENELRTAKPEDALDCVVMKEYLTEAYGLCYSRLI